MKYNVVKIVLNIILIAGISYCSANASGISEDKYPREIPVFSALSKSAPRTFSSFHSALKNIPKEINNSIIIEFYTDDMVSFGALVVTKELCPLHIDDDRIHVFRTTPQLYDKCINLLNAIASKLKTQRVFNIYKDVKKPSQSPIRYIIFNFCEKSFVLCGLECLKDDTVALDVRSVRGSALESVKDFLDFLRDNNQHEILDFLAPY